ncbi:CPBP family intramembrane glutamic endopeptidase [Microbacterium sp.]|uniref:CPBP family intramembrane glutamic endopeptidase n=1 Tax=Microbacterium sp. TaxID=51671 RepID=UPI000A46E8D0|nr:CPBP family intramembrane glutamic endopeptidase [Microbacterium sp.]MBN9186920.1 CPBP family intramembrane metalloprotease [Microbacterium sp.]MBN9191722.1 CPBP family intramembrane metalloprotease [Microbacterium sp.]
MTGDPTPVPPPVEPSASALPHGYARTRLVWEVALVLAVTVGQSAVYSVLSFIRSAIEAAQQGQNLADQQTQLNPAQDSAAFWDVLYQLLDLFFSLCLVALVVFLLWEHGGNALRRIGLDFRRFGGDAGRGILLAAVIGIPGLGLYVAGRLLGITLQVDAAPLGAAWWTVPLLLLAAVRAGLTEEVIFIGYLTDRLRRFGWSSWAIILAAAGLRGLYHAYQGVGSIVGNVVMGIVFGWCYRRWGRVMPLVIAHTLLDTVAFVGYPLAVALWPGVFGAVPSPVPSPSPSAT